MSSPLARAVAVNIGTSATTVYTVPAGYTATLVGFSVCNTTSSIVTATIQLQDSASTFTANIIKGVGIPANTTFVPSGQEQKIAMYAGDKIIVTGNTASSLDVIISIAQLAA